jgi:hypothetical protein
MNTHYHVDINTPNTQVSIDIPNGTKVTILPNGTKVTILPDGMKVWTDKDVVWTEEEKNESLQKNDTRKESFNTYNKSRVETRSKNKIMRTLEKQIDWTKHHYLNTWRYGSKKHGFNKEEAMNDIKNIRRRWISLFDGNFKSSGSKKKPYEFSNQYWFLEKDSHGQYHFHLISECIEPDLLARSLDRDSFKYKFNTIRKKILDRKQLIITEQMILNYPDFYKNHPLVGRTYDSISRYDDWFISRFLCDYMTHYQSKQRWGLDKLSNSHVQNHSRVIESFEDLKHKIEYFNKDRYYMMNDDYLGHLVPEYSDYTLQPV